MTAAVDLQIFLQAAHRVRARLENDLAKIQSDQFEMTYLRHLMLDYVARTPNCVRRDAAFALGLSEGTGSYAFKDLLKQGLVVEQLRSGYRRQKLLSLTEKGAEWLARSRGVCAAMAIELERMLGNERSRTLVQMARDIDAALPVRSRYNAKPYEPRPKKIRMHY